MADCTYRILVTGSREWDSADVVWGALKSLCDEHGADKVVIVHGGARGADALAARYAEMWGIKSEVHPARWRDLGKRAGFARNAEMVAAMRRHLDEGGEGSCLAFIKGGSRGASHCAGLAEKAEIETRRFTAA